MIAVLLLAVLLVLATVVYGLYLLFGPDPPPEAGSPRPASSAPPETTGDDPDNGPDNGPGDGGGSTGVEGPAPGPGGADGLAAAAQDYVDAVNDRDEAAATALTCGRANPGTLYSVTEGRNVRLGDVEVLEGTVGTAQVTVGGGETALLLESQEDRWCVAI
jgi:hypothetical protein